MQAEKFLENFSSHLKHAIARSISLATRLGHAEVTPSHLLLALAEEPGSAAADILKRLELNTEVLIMSLEDKQSRSVGEALTDASITVFPELDGLAKQALERAMITAFEQTHHYVGTEHLLFGLLESTDTEMWRVFGRERVSRERLRDELQRLFQNNERSVPPPPTRDILEELAPLMTDVEAVRKQEQPMNPETIHEARTHTVGQPKTPKKQRAPSALEVFTTDLTAKTMQKFIDPVIGREAEIERLIHILSRRTKNNPVLVGEPGVGKTAIVEGLAKRIVTDDVPDILKRKKILALDLTLLLSGTIYRGEFEARLKQLMDELCSRSDAILFIDEIHNIIGAGSNQGTMDAANILKPALARGLLRCIGATTIDEYKKHVSSDPALERRFQPITVDEPTDAQTRQILSGLKSYYEDFHHTSISDTALDAAVMLSRKYIHDNFLPDKAIDLVDEAAASVKVRVGKAEGKARPVVSADDVAGVVSRKLGIDRSAIQGDVWNELSGLDQALERRIVGQTTVVKQIASRLRQAHLGLGKPIGPMASFLFAGPSGVGKTELAKVLTEALYHDRKALIKLDMSEFAEAHSLSKLLGSPAGYIGYRERNHFIDSLRTRPYAVILFDEFDKAHVDVRRVLWQMLDEGYLTDSQGKKIHLRHAILVLTTNAGADLFRSGGIGFGATTVEMHGYASLRDRVMSHLKEQFGAALVGRLDDICIFEPLSPDALRQIVALRLTDLNDQMASAGRFRIVPDGGAVEQLAAEAATPELGVRQIENIMERVIHEQIAEILGRKKQKKEYTLTARANGYKLI